jgi:hypothetical protein
MFRLQGQLQMLDKLRNALDDLTKGGM